MSEKGANFYAKLVQKQGQKTALTFTTAPQISWTLHRLYPFLLIFDGFLNNLMWCCDDVCLPFIYLALMKMAVNLGSVSEKETSLLKTVVDTWLGLLSLVFLVLSVTYYISSVLRELKQDEPPTLDDIVVMMENVAYKIERMREDVAEVFKLQRGQIPSLLIVLTPIYWFMARYVISPKDYVTFLLISIATFHSSWCQCTLRLIWRSLFARQLWHMICRWQVRPHPSTDICYNIVHPALEINVPEDLASLPEPQLAVKLRAFIRTEQQIEKAPQPDRPPGYLPITVMIIEYQINENQRKWPLDGWTHNLLSYERTKFTTNNEEGQDWVASTSPWEFQETIERDWFWLDDSWIPHEWIYCDTDWDIKGAKDSLNCYTRSKSWTRSSFRVLRQS
ncbi:LANO_0E07690g1_1 [Lachancea nothofagi CBS 11611]|uniref:LANO_0E07690g1_1 n=1 Tax=Lachancea nothofagi CBS 11611 TaxID=1266666 RepID=A0A1G4JUR0_9SACH|nr:LANO_0E07690g1_1 [Lachancea nothofagi CBS 11611]